MARRFGVIARMGWQSDFSGKGIENYSEPSCCVAKGGVFHFLFSNPCFTVRGGRGEKT
jgi:hypothetical protein